MLFSFSFDFFNLSSIFIDELIPNRPYLTNDSDHTITKFYYRNTILFITLYSRKLLNNEYILRKLYGNPIGEDGTINNEYFGMSANFNYQKGLETLEGILYENN